jgi:hypothetical protein
VVAQIDDDVSLLLTPWFQLSKEPTLGSGFVGLEQRKTGSAVFRGLEKVKVCFESKLFAWSRER